MTYHITRHARIRIPQVLQPSFTVEKPLMEKESTGAKRFFQKTVGLLPIPAFGTLTGVSLLHPSLATIGFGAGTIGYSVALIGSGIVLLATTAPIYKDLMMGRRKYLPGKSQTTYTHNVIKEIEPYAEWDNVFLPYAVESFNGVKVKGSDDKFRNPVNLHTTPYIEFRTKPRTTGIDDSIMEAQQI